MYSSRVEAVITLMAVTELSVIRLVKQYSMYN
jgi:hypothetical protein